jgi:Tol biopolymer transport system component
MAPEQLEGREADARSDIFAFGAVLYEMLTGQKAFRGASNATLISAILNADPPPVSSVQPVAPPEIDRLVRTCLAKDPAERWQSAHDVELQLRAIGTSGATAMSAAVSPRPQRRAVLPWIIAAIAAVLAAASLLRGSRQGLPSPAPIRFAVPPPQNGAFLYNVEGEFLAVSPDGQSLAFVASGGPSAPSGMSPVRGTLRASGGAPARVWIRSLGNIEARPLGGTEGAESVLWSPDGRSLAFFTSDKLKRVDLPGGSPVPVCDVAPGGGVKAGTWGRRAILFTSVQGGAIYSVSPSGGKPTAFASVDPARPELRFAWPQFLPDGERYLYLVRDREGWGSLMLAEAGRPPRSVARIASSFQVVEPGYLLHVREGTLLAQRFDLASGRVTGDPVAIADGVRYFYSTAGAGFAARGGTVAFESQRDLNRLAWFDRSGREVGRLGPSDNYGFIRFAPDGKRLFFNRVRAGLGTLHIWSYDLDRQIETAVTNGQDTEAFPVPLADEKTLIYGGVRGAPPVLIRRDLASGEERLLTPQGRVFQLPQDVSPDGRTLVYTERGELGNFDVWSLALDGSSPPTPFIRSPASKTGVRFSPDGRYLAFLNSESGQLEVYVMPFPGPGEKVRISEGGASQIRWAPTGELFYTSGDRSLIAVTVKTSPRLEIGAPVKVLQISGRPWNDFDVTRDGRQFLAIVPERVADEEPLNVIANWAPPAR